jgi:hypothetical protein
LDTKRVPHQHLKGRGIPVSLPPLTEMATLLLGGRRLEVGCCNLPRNPTLRDKALALAA